MSKNSLYEITEKYLQVFDNLQIDEETGTVINIEDIEAVAGEFEEKAESVALYIKNLDAFAASLKAEEEALNERRKSAERRVDQMKNYLTFCLSSAGHDKFETPKVKVSFRKSVLVTIDDEKALPADYVVETVTTKPDKTAIRKAIQAGFEIPGATLSENRNILIK